MKSRMRFGFSALVGLVAVAAVLAPGGYLEALAENSAFVATFDGTPAVPQAVMPSGWDVTFLGDLQPIEAQHGSDCAAPPATHHVTNIEDMVFICKGHIM